MKNNIAVAAVLVGIGFAIGLGLKLLAWILFGLGVMGVVGYALTRGGSLGEDDVEEVFPDPPTRLVDERHEWRNNSAKAPRVE